MTNQGNEQNFVFSAADDQQIYCHRWHIETPRAIVQLVHGGAEHAGRYAPLARELNNHGFIVYAEDHRGHGRTGEINGELGDMGEVNAFERVCDDVLDLGRRAQVENPDIPLFILGHSLGSLITQRILLQHSTQYDGAILSGSPDIFTVASAAELVHSEVDRVGRHAVSEVLEAGILEGFNAAFPNAQTPYDWLSRDPEQVALYEQDPWCGPPLCAGAWQDLIASMLVTAEASVVSAVRADLPVYILSGEADPVHSEWAAIDRLTDNYRGAGLDNVTVAVYPGGRHEMFNETNRKQVIAQMLDWLEKRLT